MSTFTDALGEHLTASGARKGRKPQEMSYIPVHELLELAEHYHKGAQKYPPIETEEGPVDNWRFGLPWSGSYNALMRHALQFWGGEDVDEDTGSKHVIAVAWHALALAYFMNNCRDFDDRSPM